MTGYRFLLFTWPHCALHDERGHRLVALAYVDPDVLRSAGQAGIAPRQGQHDQPVDELLDRLGYALFANVQTLHKRS